MDLNNLKYFLESETIPVTKNKFGFLEIIRKQHYETINSNLYAHFLSCEIDAVRALFLDALLALIYQKSKKQLVFVNDRVSTEVSTISNGKIDILIEDFYYQNAVIIENKIYHHLDNDLLDYWNHYKIDDSKKVGVLLTLRPHEIPENVKGNFINITHLEWINKIKENYVADSYTSNYKVYIQDFINTIEILSSTKTMNESAKFYFQNASQVIKASETLNEANQFLNNQFQLIAEKIGWQLHGSRMTWRNFWDENNNIDTYLTIITKELVQDGILKFSLILELNREDKALENEVREKFKNHKQVIGKKRGDSKDSYVHFICKDYTLTLDELAHFSDIVVEKIQNDFAEITIDVIKYLYPTKDISTFENQVLKVIE